MTTAERMRKYRARKRLIAAIQKAEKEGIDVLSVLDECSMQMLVPGIPGSPHRQDNSDGHYGEAGGEVVSIEKRIIAALKTIAAVRVNIRYSFDTYSDTMAPNLQSVSDILTMPDSMLDQQLDQAAEIFTCARVTPEEVETIKRCWVGE